MAFAPGGDGLAAGSVAISRIDVIPRNTHVRLMSLSLPFCHVFDGSTGRKVTPVRRSGVRLRIWAISRLGAALTSPSEFARILAVTPRVRVWARFPRVREEGGRACRNANA